MEGFIEGWGDFGPLVVFLLLLASGFGIPIGEEVVNIPAGYLIAQGHLNPWLTVLAAYFGIVTADIIWFTICSRYGARLLQARFFRKLLHPRRILQAKHQVEKHGAWFIVIARFIPSSRTAAITMSGMLHLQFWKFILAEVLCVAVTAPLQILAGYLIGSGVTSPDTATHVRWIVGIIIVVILLPIVVGVVIRMRIARKVAPRARARWLRKFRAARRIRTRPAPENPV